MAVASGSDPATTLFDLIQSQRITAVLYVTARLGVADLLAAGPQTAVELAPRCGAHAPSLRRLLRALVGLGVCTDLGNDSYDLTATGHLLAAGN